MAETQFSSTSPSSGRVWIVSDTRDARWARTLLNALEQQGHRGGIYPMAEAVASVALDSVGSGLDRLKKLIGMGERGTALIDDLRSSPPRLVIVRSPNAARLFLQLRQLTGESFALLALISDFQAPEAWVDIDVDFVVAPSAEQLDWMGAGELTPERRIIAGPLTPFDLPEAGSRERLRTQLKAADDTLVVFVDASRMLPAMIDQVIYQVGTLGPKPEGLEFLFYYGGSEDNARVLREASTARRVHAKMFGLSMPVERVLSGVDIAILPERSELSLAAVYLGVPLIGIGTDAGQHILAQHGVLVPLHQPASLAALLQELRSRGIAQTQRDALVAVRLLVNDEDVHQAILQLLKQVNTTDVAQPKRREGEELMFEQIGRAPLTDNTVQVQGLSPSAAREEYARLVLEQRRLEKLHEKSVEQRDLWILRHQDAQNEKQEDLAEFADQMLQQALQEVSDHQKQLDALLDTKEQLRAQVFGGSPRGAATLNAPSNTPAMMEKRFLEMESRRQLRELRDRAKRRDR